MKARVVSRTSRRCFQLVVALMAVTTPIDVRAAALQERDVRAAIETWVRNVTADARQDAVVERATPYVVDGETVAYIVELQGGGFCLAGADEQMTPVTFYSPHGRYDPHHAGCQTILDEMAHRWVANRKGIQTPSAQSARRDAERADQWRSLIGGLAPISSSDLSIAAAPALLELPLTSTWDQPWPYNQQCPGFPSGEHVLVGCNATATSQVLYYWKWPLQGTGTVSTEYDYQYGTGWTSVPIDHDPHIPNDTFWLTRLAYSSGRLYINGYWDLTAYQAALGIDGATSYRNALLQLWQGLFDAISHPTVNLNDHSYDWSLMRDKHDSTTTAAENAEVAELCRDVAIAGQAGFGLFSTGGWNGNNTTALRNNFFYDPDVLFTESADHGGPGVDPNVVIDEIQWGRPITIGGNPFGKGGHCWVIYGYNTNARTGPQFKMNFGWSGDSDGWYSLDSCCPTNNNHDMMSRIAPLKVKFVGGGVSGDGSPANPYRDLYQAVSLFPPTARTLILKAGSVNSFNGTINPSSPIKLTGVAAVIQ